MMVCNGLYQAQTKAAAGSPSTRIHPVEPAGNFVDLVLGNAGAGIRHRKHDVLPTPDDRETNAPIIRCVLDRIIQQVHDQLEYEVAITANLGVGVELGLDFDATL